MEEGEKQRLCVKPFLPGSPARIPEPTRKEVNSLV
jgi:hypothetical protein